MRVIGAGVLAGVVVAAATVSAQWLDHPTPGLPRTKDGKVNLTARAPKTRDGKPAVSGVWRPQFDPNVKGTNGEELPRYFVSILASGRTQHEGEQTSDRRHLADPEQE